MTHLSERQIFVDADYRLRLWLWVDWCVDSFVRYNGVVVVRQNGGAFTPYVLFADEQGSVLTVADKDGNRVFEASYDAWGRQTVSTNTIGFTRGYTGHEMLAELGIINMGGRLYDPVLGRFFSPDNYVQAPTDSQNFNRYSYCLNNPLKYTDPTGQLINPFAVLAILNIGKSIIDAATGKSSWKAALFNIASAALTYGIGQAFGTVGGIGHELLRAGAHGLSTGVFTVLGGGNFGSGFVCLLYGIAFFIVFDVAMKHYLGAELYDRYSGIIGISMFLFVALCYVPVYMVTAWKDTYLKFFNQFEKKEERWQIRIRIIALIFAVLGFGSIFLAIMLSGST